MALSDEELIAQFQQRFEGRSDVYAVGQPHRKPEKAAKGKLEYFPVERPVTADVIRSHLKGEALVGVYPIVEGKAKWFAIDFDGEKDPDTGMRRADSYETSLAAAEEQAEKLEEVGFQVYLERSRSGEGVHLWGFFDEWLELPLIHDAVKPYFIKTVTLDRMFPVQRDTKGLKADMGNLIALPYYGKAYKEGFSAFVDRTVLTPVNPREFLEGVFTNSRDAVVRIAESAPRVHSSSRALGGTTGGESNPDFQGRPDRPMRRWLMAQSPYGCGFLHEAYKQRRTLPEPLWYAVIQQTTCFENGREIAHIISRDHPGYSADETNAKYDHACESPPMGCAWVHEHAPAMACKGCPLTAPYHVASKPILDLVQETDTSMEQGGYDGFLDKVMAYDSGALVQGIKVGLPGLDTFFTLRRSEFTIVAARPSMGKTMWMVDVSQLLGAKGIPVFRFSAETGRDGLMARDLGREAEVNTEALRGERMMGEVRQMLSIDEKERLQKAVPVLNQRSVSTNYTALDPDRIIEIVESEMIRLGVGFDEHIVLFMDYIQFGVKKPGESGYERVSRLSTQFKYIAKILNCSVISFAQLNREAEDEIPGLHNLKESGQLEQDADAVIFLHGEREAGVRSARQMIVAKQREGQVGTAHFILRKDVSRFEPLYGQTPDNKPVLFTLESEDSNDQ